MMCKTKRPIMILTIALTLFLAWGITGTGKKAQALCDLENTTGITVYENVILSEHEKENYRKYAIQEKYSDTFCSGYRTLSETRTPIDFSKGGVMIEVPATGESTTIRLLETWHSEAVDTIPWGKAGGFSIIGQPIMEDIYFNVSTDNCARLSNHRVYVRGYSKRGVHKNQGKRGELCNRICQRIGTESRRNLYRNGRNVGEHFFLWAGRICG